jgi:hypothetical protein
MKFDFNSISETRSEKCELLEGKFEYIKDEIDTRVESLVNQVHEMGDRLKEKVQMMEKKALE